MKRILMKDKEDKLLMLLVLDGASILGKQELKVKDLYYQHS